jgi:hypothetical protein
MLRMFLECARCETRRLWQPDEEAALSLRDRGACLLACEICHTSTYWLLPSHERRAHPAHRDSDPPVPPPPPAPRTDRTKHVNRVEHRVPLKLPVRVRVWALDGLEEVTTTKNVSRGGLFFETAVGFHVGQEVRVALHYAGKSSTVLEQAGHIVRVETVAGSLRKGVAVRYDNERTLPRREDSP